MKFPGNYSIFTKSGHLKVTDTFLGFQIRTVKFFRIGNIGEIGAQQCTELVEAAGRIFAKK